MWLRYPNVFKVAYNILNFPNRNDKTYFSNQYSNYWLNYLTCSYKKPKVSLVDKL